MLLQVLPGLKKQRENKDVIPLMYSLLVAGKAYLGKGDYPASLRHLRELYQLAERVGNKQFLKDGAQFLLWYSSLGLILLAIALMTRNYILMSITFCSLFAIEGFWLEIVQLPDEKGS